MPKLARNYYRTADGQKKINCYMANIPKEIVNQAGFEDGDEIRITARGEEIIIEKKYHFVCMECGYDWTSGKPYTIQSYCPQCRCGDLEVIDNDN